MADIPSGLPMLSDRKPEPASFQAYVLSLVYGLPILMASARVFGLRFPISDPATATRIIPKLAKNAVCLQGHMASSAINTYVLTYANLTIWLGTIGFLAGFVVDRFIVRSASDRRLLQGSVVDSALRKEGANLPDGPGTRPLAGVLAWGVILGMMAIVWLTTFYWSACTSLRRGLPLYRSFDGIVPTIMSFLFFFVVGFFLKFAFRLSARMLRV
jgi:hypothetical protein